MSDLATFVKNLDPIFVIAPTARNGVTLVQRLLNSSKQIIVYGENSHFMHTLSKHVYQAVQVHTEHAVKMNQARKQFLEETTEGWTSNLWPDTQVFMMLAFEAFYKEAVAYQQCSEQYGYQRWGIKNPLIHPDMIKHLKILMPKAKFVFIYRNILDVVRSALSRNFIATDAQIAQYATQWKQFLRDVVAAKHPDVSTIQYEKLVESPEPILNELEQFTGITNIDPTVMQRKFNTFQIEDKNRTDTNIKGYVKPHDLTTSQKKIVVDLAGKTMQQFGYALS